MAADPELDWRTGPMPGHLCAFNPDGSLYATVLPSLLRGVVASVSGHRLWYAAERLAFSDLESRHKAEVRR